MRTFFTSIIILLALPAYCQFQNTIGIAQADIAKGVIETSDGNYVFCGNSYSFSNNLSMMYLVKLSPLGDTLWTHLYSNGNLDFAEDIIETNDGGLAVTGGTFTGLNNYQEVFLMKLDEAGNFEWMNAYGGNEYDMAYSLDQSPNGEYVMAGFTASYTSGGNDVYIIKTDETGNLIWANSFGGSATDEAHEVLFESDGSIIIGGTVRSNLESYDGLIMKTDADGMVQWANAFGGSLSGEDMYGLSKTSDGGYILTGNTFSFEHDVYIVKTDNLGEVVWSKLYGGDGDDTGNSICMKANGGFLIGAQYVNIAQGPDAFVINIDSNGDTLWTRSYGGASEDYCHDLCETSTGKIAIAGATASSGFGNGDFYMLCSDANGATSCNDLYHQVNVSSAATISQNWTYQQNDGAIVTNLIPNHIHGGNLIQCPAPSVVYELNATEIQVFPNPSSDVVHIVSDDYLLNWQMIDLRGRIVLEKTGLMTKSSNIQVGDLLSGEYILKAITKAGVSYSLIQVR